MKTMYELNEVEIQIAYKDRYRVKRGCVFDFDKTAYYPELIKSFTSEEDALNELKKYESSAGCVGTYHGKVFVVKEYYVEEVIYDDDDEYESGNILEFAEMKFEVYSTSESRVIGEFDNYADAEECLEEYLFEEDEEGNSKVNEGYIC